MLHLATHGIFDDRSPMHSHVLLARGASPDDDGLLEAWEILSLALHANLVVLSACESGRGRVAPGEGLIGLSWALAVAGARTTIVSQWKVDSASTTALMLAFHRERRRGASTAQALRRGGRAACGRRPIPAPVLLGRVCRPRPGRLTTWCSSTMRTRRILTPTLLDRPVPGLDAVAGRGGWT